MFSSRKSFFDLMKYTAPCIAVLTYLWFYGGGQEIYQEMMSTDFDYKEVQQVSESEPEKSGTQKKAKALKEAKEEFTKKQKVIHEARASIKSALESGRVSEKQAVIAKDTMEISEMLEQIAAENIEEGEIEASETFLGLSEDILDIALDFIPGVSIGKDIFELFTGKSLVTGEPLDGVQRAVAAIGVLTLGSSNFALKGAQVLMNVVDPETVSTLVVSNEIISSAAELGMDTGSELQSAADFVQNVIASDDNDEYDPNNIAKDIKKIFKKVDGNALKAYGDAKNELKKSGLKVSKDTSQYMAKSLLRIEGNDLKKKISKEEFVVMAKNYESISEKIKKVKKLKKKIKIDINDKSTLDVLGVDFGNKEMSEEGKKELLLQIEDIAKKEGVEVSN